jgi:hypothetical protein
LKFNGLSFRKPIKEDQYVLLKTNKNFIPFGFCRAGNKNRKHRNTMQNAEKQVELKEQDKKLSGIPGALQQVRMLLYFYNCL